ARAAAEPVAAALGDLQTSVPGRRLKVLADAIDTETRQAEADHDLLSALTDHRSTSEHLGGSAVDAGYAAIFRRIGLEPEDRATLDVVEQLSRRPAAVVREVVAALDDWALFLSRSGKKPARLAAVLEVARGLDQDPLRNQVRVRLGHSDLRTS